MTGQSGSFLSTALDPFAGIDREINQVEDGSTPKVGRGKQQFHGTNVILCNGAIVMGRDWPFLLITFLLYSIPCILFAIFSLPFLITYLGKWILIPSIIFPLLFLIFAAKTGLSDPGIIPRYSSP